MSYLVAAQGVAAGIRQKCIEGLRLLFRRRADRKQFPSAVADQRRDSASLRICEEACGVFPVWSIVPLALRRGARGGQ